jgi:hypothetical protein
VAIPDGTEEGLAELEHPGGGCEYLFCTHLLAIHPDVLKMRQFTFGEAIA